jgi:hypothetical protein
MGVGTSPPANCCAQQRQSRPSGLCLVGERRKKTKKQSVTKINYRKLKRKAPETGSDGIFFLLASKQMDRVLEFVVVGLRSHPPAKAQNPESVGWWNRLLSR